MTYTIKEAALRKAFEALVKENECSTECREDGDYKFVVTRTAWNYLSDPTLRRAIYEEVLAEEMAKLGVPPVCFLHCQGNHSETSIRQLDTQEIERGWTQQPLHTAAQLQAAVRGEREYWLCCGSLDPQVHRMGCIEARRGFPEHCRYGTAKEHSEWQLSARSQGAEKGEDKSNELV